MKIRESGMPPLEKWEQFFDTEHVLDALQLPSDCQRVVEFGCGYGTFTLAAAARIDGTVCGVEIDPVMVATVRERASAFGLDNVELVRRDFVARGTGQADSSADYVMLFNILHHDKPGLMLAEAWRVLRGGGYLAIVHWNHDETTPRGPPMAIRPRPDQCLEWAVDAGFESQAAEIDLPPYHFGLILEKPGGES
ncbi:MAG: class I SAM-dependent methyltransferase [Pseudomonadota bacterium]